MEYRHPKQIWKDPTQNILDFGRLFCIGFFIIGLFLQWRAINWQISWSIFSAHADVAFIWWLVGSAILTLSTLTPWMIRPIYFLWIFLGQSIGCLLNYLLLLLVFYFIFTPVGICYRRWCRVITKDKDSELATYWEKKILNEDTKRYYRQF